MKSKVKEKFWILLIIVLTILALVSGYYALKLKENH